MENIVLYDYVLVKLASRCNLKCTYCYWFKDEDVYKKPKLLTLEAEDQFIIRLKAYLLKYELSVFEVILHGGEPLLFGMSRFENLCNKLRNLEKELGITLTISLTTNAILIDSNWANLFNTYSINVGISVDGNEKINDLVRIDFKGRGTFSKIKESINILKNHNIKPGVLAVCMVDEDPEEVCKGIINDLGIKHFDILIPDATYIDNPKSILKFYKKLFDLWYEEYYKEGIFITIIECLIRGIIGHHGISNAMGYTPVKTITLLPDGSLEPLDYLRVSGTGFTASTFNVFDNELEDLQKHPLWGEVYHASLNLSEKCNICKYKYACGGGPVQSRWNKQNRFDNPSVYCEDLFSLFEYVENRLSKDIYTEKQTITEA